MKILITGASGFIGSFAVEEALNRGFEVWAGVRETSSREYLNLPGTNFVDLPYASTNQLIEKLEEMKQKIGKWDIIVHIMGLTKCKQKSDFDRVNFQYTKNFIDALRQTEMVPQQFIYMSSLSAMGSGDPVTLKQIDYTDIPNPNTLYGQSKLRTENYLRSLPEFPSTILRPTGVYGPREKDYFVMLQTIKRHFNPAIGFKPQYITFIYVKDLVKVIFACIEKQKIHETYFVADGDVWTSDDYAALCKRLLGVSWTIPLRVPCFLVKGICAVMEEVGSWFGKFPTLNNDKYNILSSLNWKCDTKKLVDDLEFKADYGLEAGLEESIQWYRENGWLD